MSKDIPSTVFKVPNAQYIISIGEYVTKKDGFDVSVYKEIENTIDFKTYIFGKPTYTETIPNEKPPDEQSCFITIGLMTTPYYGAMAFGPNKNYLINNAKNIFPYKWDKLDGKIKYIGKGKIYKLHEPVFYN